MSVDAPPSTRRYLPGLRKPEEPAAPPIPQPPPLQRVPGRRNPRWIALGVLALCLGGLLSYVIYAKVAAQTAVVAMAHTVHRGAIIQTGDLTTLTISGTASVSTVPAASLDQLVGRRAVVDLVEGLPAPAVALSDLAVPGPGRAVVGLKLSQGRVPASLLEASAPIRLIPLPAPEGQATKPVAQTYPGQVVDQRDGADGTSVLLDVDVAASDAPAITVLAAQDRIAVLREADR